MASRVCGTEAPTWIRLVALGSTASFVYSVYALFAMTGAQARGDAAQVMGWMHEFYFESAAMILTLITVGKMLEARSKGRTTDALKGLMKLAPQTATLLVEGSGAHRAYRDVKQGTFLWCALVKISPLTAWCWKDTAR